MDIEKKSVYLYRMFFLIHECIMLYFLFLAPFRNPISDGSYHYNLKPFHEIQRFIRYSEYFDWKQLTANLAGNVIAFMPFGFLLPGSRKKGCGVLRAFFTCFAITLMIESLQLATGRGCFDVDDLFLNTIGGMAGYFCYVLIERKLSAHKAKSRKQLEEAKAARLLKRNEKKQEAVIAPADLFGVEIISLENAAEDTEAEINLGHVVASETAEEQKRCTENEQKTTTENCKKAD